MNWIAGTVQTDPPSRRQTGGRIGERLIQGILEVEEKEVASVSPSGHKTD